MENHYIFFFGFDALLFAIFQIVDQSSIQKNISSSSSQRANTYSSVQNDEDVLLREKEEKKKVEAKIKQLLSDISIQKHHMIQASHALNTCAATFEFSGSTESVVAEWKLLVTSKLDIFSIFIGINNHEIFYYYFFCLALSREAAINELNRLRSQNYIRDPSSAQDCGCLTLSDLSLPLRQQYIGKLASDAIWGHQLVCILKLRDSEQVISTKTIPTLPGLLAVKFPDTIQLKNVYADFCATLEIYGMVAQREILPHDIKYHIKPKKFAGLGLLTPKNKKSSEPRPLMTPVQSPAGENAIRTSNFKHFGSVEITLRDIQRTNWPIIQLNDESPLNGVLSMKVNCELAVKVEHKAFLTMFEDVSGFGAWHRRWCYLNGSILNYWKYPDDMAIHPPIGYIDLTLSRQNKITVAPRDICARMNTILIELVRRAHPNDQESLVVFRNGNETTYRHLLSCDTKEERNEWCMYFNKVLQLNKALNSK